MIDRTPSRLDHAGFVGTTLSNLLQLGPGLFALLVRRLKLVQRDMLEQLEEMTSMVPGEVGDGRELEVFDRLGWPRSWSDSGGEDGRRIIADDRRGRLHEERRAKPAPATMLKEEEDLHGAPDKAGPRDS